MEQMAASRQFVRACAGAMVAVLFLASVLQGFLGSRSASVSNIDFLVYFCAGKVLHSQPHTYLYQASTGGNPQEQVAPAGSPMADAALAMGQKQVQLYLYPPLLADLLSPLTRLPFAAAAALWTLLNIGFALLSGLLLAHAFGARLASPYTFLLAGLAFTFFPMHEAITLGQVTVLLMLLWTFGVYAYIRGWKAWSAVAFALATGLKVLPILLVPLFLLWKDRRWLLAYAGALLTLIAVMLGVNGESNLLGCFTVLGKMTGAFAPFGNESVTGVAGWWLFRTPNALDAVWPRAAVLLAKALSGLLYLACLAVVFRRQRGANTYGRARVLALFSFVVLFVSPISWRHMYAVCLVAFVLLWAECFSSRRSHGSVLLLLAATVSVGSVVVEEVAAAHLPWLITVPAASLWVLLSIALTLRELARPGKEIVQPFVPAGEREKLAAV